MRPAPIKETQKNNLEAELVFIRTEIDEKTKILSELYEKIQDCNVVFDGIRKQEESVKALRIKNESELTEKKQEWDVQVKALENKHESNKVALYTLQEEIKESNRELAKLNHQCLVASDELEVKAILLDEMSMKISSLSSLIPELEKVKQELEFYTSKRDEVQIDIVNRLAASEGLISKNTAQLAQITAACDAKIQEMNDAEYKLKVYTDSLYTHMNDYAIIRERLNIRWKEIYPELKLPLE